MSTGDIVMIIVLVFVGIVVVFWIILLIWMFGIRPYYARKFWLQCLEKHGYTEKEWNETNEQNYKRLEKEQQVMYFEKHPNATMENWEHYSDLHVYLDPDRDFKYFRHNYRLNHPSANKEEILQAYNQYTGLNVKMLYDCEKRHPFFPEVYRYYFATSE